MTIETTQINASFKVQMRRYKDFAGIKIKLPKEIQHWARNRERIEQWLIPINVFDDAVWGGDLSDILIVAKEFNEHYHHVFTQSFLDNYHSGQTCRSIDYDNLTEDVDVLKLTKNQQKRIFQFDDDHWLRRNGKVLARDLLLCAWPKTYGSPQYIKTKALENKRTISAEIEPNTCWQNHEISGTHEVWVRVRLSDEEIATYIEKDYLANDRYVFIDLLGFKDKSE